MLEQVTCYTHGAEPVLELEWTTCLVRDGERVWGSDIRHDVRAALDEIADGTCPWTEPPTRIEWVPPEEALSVAERVFWSAG
ncbi:hypothetical protein GXP71_08130 [Cellulomonas sp. H30R-01]|uniref:hypothetical protein n=1 Tax=Cellulomonas sp. H30R-01 TaxID=2704467 RepID=UPI00138B27A0|nr:hypothetical protein [Cellulomonas sp. H30R-01]QHT56049.1 hypothetical protein GXP71_08130 [Cellulomonas sp. H30R-01]